MMTPWTIIISKIKELEEIGGSGLISCIDSCWKLDSFTDGYILSTNNGRSVAAWWRRWSTPESTSVAGRPQIPWTGDELARVVVVGLVIIVSEICSVLSRKLPKCVRIKFPTLKGVLAAPDAWKVVVWLMRCKFPTLNAGKVVWLWSEWGIFSTSVARKVELLCAKHRLLERPDPRVVVEVVKLGTTVASKISATTVFAAHLGVVLRALPWLHALVESCLICITFECADDLAGLTGVSQVILVSNRQGSPTLPKYVKDIYTVHPL